MNGGVYGTPVSQVSAQRIRSKSPFPSNGMAGVKNEVKVQYSIHTTFWKEIKEIKVNFVMLLTYFLGGPSRYLSFS